MAVNYYDRFDPVTKKWDRILFIPGRGLQSAELNELQSIQDWKLKKLSDVFISDGSVIQGCAIISPDTFPDTVTVQEGYIYIDGKILWTDEQAVTGTFQGVGIEYIYLNVEEEIVTEVEDSDLNDPAIEEVNFGLPGAHRKILNISFTDEANKTDTSIRWDFVFDGKQLFKRATFGGDKIIAAVEQRTYEKHGNFLVNGADITIKTVEDDDTKYSISIDPYNVYLKGRRYVSQFSQVNEIDKPIITFEDQDVLSIAQNSGSRSGGTNNVFPILGTYPKQVLTVTYPVQALINLTHSVAGGVDNLGVPGSIAQVQSVEGEHGVYAVDDDYIVNFSDRSIDWSPPAPGVEPGVGNTYTALVVYYKTVSINEGDAYPSEFRVDFPDSTTGDYRDAEIVITDPQYYSGVLTNFVNPEYLRFKRRIDAVVIDTETGIVETRLGEDVEFLPVPLPPVRDTDFILYLIYTNPGEYYDPLTYQTDDLRVVRITQRGLNVMKRQLRDVQSNLALAQLDVDAAAMPVPGVLNGIFTDTFETRDKSDTFYLGGSHYSPQGEDILPNPFRAGFDDGMLSSSIIIDDNNQEPSVYSSTLREGETVYTLPISSEETWLEQPLANTYVSLQPYALPKGRPEITIDPANDIWTENNTIEVIVKTENKIIKKTVEVEAIQGSGVTREVIAEELELIGVSTEHTVVKYARSIDIDISGRGWFVPGELSDYSLDGDMAGVEIPEFETMTLQSDGTFEGTFSIPEAQIPSGNAPIEVRTDPYYLQAQTNFFSHGSVLTTTKSYKKIVTIKETTQVVVETNDPEPDDPGVGGQCKLTLATAWRTGQKTAQAKMRWWAIGADSIKIFVRYKPNTGSFGAYSLRKSKEGLDSTFSEWQNKWKQVKQTFPSTNYGTVVYDLKWNNLTEVKLEAYLAGKKVCTKLKQVSGHEFLADWADPVAQTFITDEEMFISSIGVYFNTKSSEGHHVECFIAEVINGYPSRSYLGRAFKDVDDVTTSSDSSAETIFEFDDLVHLESNTEYAIVLKSADPVYTVFIADMQPGHLLDVDPGPDLLTGNPIETQPYDGVFFQSANQSTWTAFQRTDLKFKIYRAHFTSSGTLTMQTQNLGNPSATPPTGYSWLKMLVSYIDPSDSDLFMYNKVEGADFERIQMGEKKKLTAGGLAGQCQIKFEMQTNNELISPILNKSIGTLYWKYAKHAWWYSSLIDFGIGNEFDKVKIRTYLIDRNVPFRFYVAASYTNDPGAQTWYLFNSATIANGGNAEETSQEQVDVNINSYLHEYTLNMQDVFSGLNLARYARFVIEIGNEQYDGSDSPRFYDFRAVAFEEIA